jgi:hypothetical protein
LAHGLVIQKFIEGAPWHDEVFCAPPDRWKRPAPDQGVDLVDAAADDHRYFSGRERERSQIDFQAFVGFALSSHRFSLSQPDQQ